jgi:thymidylate synthase (FAD)
MPNLVVQSFGLINPPDEDTIIKSIVDAARVCYLTEDMSAPDANKKLFDKLWERKHLAMFEHAHIAARLVVDRGVTHELVRHRIGVAFAQESTRYCNYSTNRLGNEIKVISPFKTAITDYERAGGDPAKAAWWSAVSTAEESYFKMIKNGYPPEIARSVLPTCTASTIVVTANIREWFHIFSLRAQPEAHPAMRSIMYEVLRKFVTLYPFIFGRIKEYLPEQVEPNCTC